MEDTLFTFDPVKERKNALLAIPKKGRLYERCMKLLEGAGLDHHRPNRLDVAHCTGLPVTIVFLPASDIASCKSINEKDKQIGLPAF
jgi:ATP phosphoribosyltransferase